MILWQQLIRPVGLAGILALAAVLLAVGGATGADWLKIAYGLIALESALILLPARSRARKWNIALAPPTSRGFRIAIRAIVVGLILLNYVLLGWMVHIACKAIRHAQLKPVSMRLHRMQDLRENL